MLLNSAENHFIKLNSLNLNLKFDLNLKLLTTEMDQQKRHKVLQSVMWDYSISADDMEKLLDGRIDKAGHYTRQKLFAKMLTGLPWYTIIQLLPVENIKEMLTDDIIGVLWPKSVQKQYEYVRKRLQETLPGSG